MTTLQGWLDLDIRHKVGDTWTLRVDRQDSAGAAINLTGRTYRCMWRVNPADAAPAATATIDTANLATGTVTATVSAATSTTLAAGDWLFDLEETNGTVITTIAAGAVHQIADVSR